ncbi:hypothetical protein AQI96_07680 [Streptomyces canus]|nr:hypothetical protein AQI96_07680 [Streptomyces canus]
MGVGDHVPQVAARGQQLRGEVVEAVLLRAGGLQNSEQRYSAATWATAVATSSVDTGRIRTGATWTTSPYVAARDMCSADSKNGVARTME